jgi:hypothetical protein
LAASCAKDKPFKMPEMKVPDALKPDPPDEKIRKQIASVLKSEDDARFHREVSDLLYLAKDLKWDSRRLASEVIDYSAKVDAKDPPAQAKYVRMLAELGLPRSSVVDVAATRLENGADDAVAKALLNAAAPPDARGPADFSHFHAYLEVRRAQPPEKLILWMYQRDPTAALREMMSLYAQETTAEESRSMLVASRVIDQMEWKQRSGLARADEADELAAEQVQHLSQSKAWWVRLYAAEVLARQPILRKAEVLKALAQDQNPLVRKAMRRAGA